LTEEDVTRDNLNLLLAVEKAVGMERNLTVLERIFSGIEGIIEDKGLVRRKILQFSPAPVVNEHGEVRKFSL